MSFVEYYFKAEKAESVVFMLVGGMAVLLACFFLLVIKYRSYVGAGVPLLLIGIIQVAVGLSVYLHSDADIQRVGAYVLQLSDELYTQELPRIDKVLVSFKIIKYGELSLLVLALVLIVRNYKDANSLWFGLGLGLFLMASVSLVLDVYAERRAIDYKQHLEHLIHIHLPSSNV